MHFHLKTAMNNVLFKGLFQQSGGT